MNFNARFHNELFFCYYDDMENPLPSYLKKIRAIKSQKILEAFGAIDRADFVPKEMREAAYVDEALSIGEGQTISQPYTVAFMLELLDPRPGEKIMDIGAGSGWQSAILAQVVSQDCLNSKFKNQNEKLQSKIKNSRCGKVYSMERVKELCEFGRKNLEKYNFISNGVVEWHCKDASNGLPEEAPFDKIIAAAALDKDIPQAWKNQLKIGGVIVAPIGSSIWKFTKKKDNDFEKEEFPGFAFVPFIFTPSREKASEFIPFVKNKAPTNILSIIVGLLLLLGIFYYLFFSPPVREFTEKKKKIFHIEKGENLSEISQNLKSKGFIKNSFIFKTFFSLMAGENKVKAGDYLFEKPLSVLKIKNRLAEGIYGLLPVKITILEGWTVKDIGFYFENLEVFQAEEFYLPFAREEGYLFPDTYFFDANDLNPEIIAKTMRENFEKKITPEIMAEIEQRGKNLKEIIIMASLIEKEMSSPEDGRIISGILWKRFESKMGLQVDATLTYLTGKPSLKLTEEDLAIDSRYNTYKYRGLPAGPISNPGLEAIKAAVFPEKSPYWYYLHDSERQPHYARDFEEHKANKIKYLK